jgi:hypothetical protein
MEPLLLMLLIQTGVRETNKTGRRNACSRFDINLFAPCVFEQATHAFTSGILRRPRHYHNNQFSSHSSPHRLRTTTRPRFAPFHLAPRISALHRVAKDNIQPVRLQSGLRLDLLTLLSLPMDTTA